MKPRLYMIIPCYNEEKVLPITSEMFLEELNLLIAKDKISENSRILFVNDGSKDKTWDLIKELSEKDEHFIGICQSRNRGHQNAVLAGMMEAKDVADITISIDCDGQDDIAAMEAMVDRYHEGCEIVYGVRSNRDTDTFFKRFKGLMGRKSLAEGAGLLIEPCNQIHTFGMKFAIDTLTLDKDDVILYIDHEIQPGKIRKMVSKGRRVLELPSGTANKYMLQVGQVISVE